MNATPLLAAILLLGAQTMRAAVTVPPFEWAVSGGGEAADKTRCVSFDPKGNALLAGECTGPFKFAGTEVAGAGQLDFFVAKLSATGAPLWIQTGGGSAVDRAYGVASDAQGNVYAAGHYQSQDATFSGTKLPPARGYDLFLAKYSPEGKLLWIQTAGSEGYDYAHGVAVDPKGNVLIAGALAGSADFGGYKVERPQGGHLFCAKYDPSGKVLWVKTASGAATNAANGIAVDASGNAYVAGSSSGKGTFGNSTLEATKGQDAVVAKLNPEGEVLWVNTHHGETGCLFHEIACDASGEVWACGMFKNKATFGTQTFASSNEKDSDAFFVHYDKAGKLQWAHALQGPGVDYGLGVATDGKGNAFFTGEFSNSVQIGAETLTSAGSTDVYLACFNKRGALSWIAQAGGASGDNAYSLAFHPSLGLLLGGSFTKETTFGTRTLQSSGSGDFYAALLKLAPPQPAGPAK